MAITFDNTFGKRTQAAQAAAGTERPKAKFWLNIGYPVEYQGEEGIETRFVSLPVGIPLDTQEQLPTNSRNDQFAAFQSARNDLLAQIMSVAESLKSGEEQTLNLTIQLRRVNDELAPVKSENNPFSKKIELVAAKAA
jgi:2-methylcitrate dehydratase PrpD